MTYCAIRAAQAQTARIAENLAFLAALPQIDAAWEHEQRAESERLRRLPWRERRRAIRRAALAVQRRLSPRRALLRPVRVPRLARRARARRSHGLRAPPAADGDPDPAHPLRRAA